MSTGTSCALYVAGVRFPDGQPGEDDTAPVALSGLQVTWGRTTTVDQPDAATCEFDVADVPTGEGFAQLLATGLPVLVNATGVSNPGPDQPSFIGGGFDTATGTPRGDYTGATAQVVATSGAPSPPNAVLLTATADTATALVPPAAYSAAPAAWDELPTTAAGDSWQASAWVKAPAGAQLTLTPALFASPNDHAPTLLTAAAATVTADGSWQQLVSIPTVPTDGQWVGIKLTLAGILPAWQDMPPTQSWAATPLSWQEYKRARFDSLDTVAPENNTTTVAVFAGRITDLDAAWDDSVGGNVIHVTATDFTADLENVNIGDEPWAVESMASRFNRIVTETGLPVDAIIDDSISPILVSYQDVDNQAALGLLQDLAQSVDGVLWSAVHRVSGAYLWVEDPSNRTPLYTLDDSTGVVVIVPVSNAADALQLSACDVLRDPVHWAQSVSDVSTRVAVTWLEQGIDDEGNPATTDRTVTVVDTSLEADYGVRRISYSTLLQAEADAQQVASQVLARTSLTGWRASGLQIDDADLAPTADNAAMLLQLLDGTARIGQPLAITDLPEWSPVAGSLLPVYLEGGTYAYVDGFWVLSLTVSRAGAVGESVAWNDLDTSWSWDDFSTAISWIDLIGVTYP